MLNSTTKNRINSCRDMLVGKLPDPKSQIDQITNALVYKFMDDQDRMSRELGYDASFFIGDYEQYAWSKLFDNRLTNQEKANLYSEGLDKLSVADHLPELFKQIFKNARLPFKDPSTITMFLAEINGFSYHHSEELGNAFEYLLSVMGSQGDTGSFRTPRHIIEFLVDVVDPKRGETIYDPACGTAGFLIEAFNHIKSAGDLSVSDTATLGKNISGVDIDPGMAKIARVNLYLHGFKTPNIDENDTLSNEKLWGMKRDVILANPPFMTPKGGIRPHEKFSSKTSKSEVLFTDYIIEHLKLHGRAGIIVPEGIMFNGSNAYKDLRKKLVDGGYLWAVASLPSGVFNPYAGVKTSILFLDRERAKNNDSILFVKISADGYDLGAQRRPIEKNDLPKALEILNAYKENLTINLENEPLAHLVPKSKIAESGEYNLSIDRYNRPDKILSTDYKISKLGEVVDIKTGKKDVNEGNPEGEYPFFTCAKEHTFSKTYSFDTEALLVAGNGDVGAVKYYKGKFEAYQRTYVLSNFRDILPRYLYQILNAKLKETVSAQKLGNTMPYIKLGMLTDFEIPLPPLEIQEQIVAELDGYQRIIDGARAVIENYKPTIKIDSEWEMVELGKVTKETKLGLVKNKGEQGSGDIKYIKMDAISEKGELDTSKFVLISASEKEISEYALLDGDFIYNTRNAPNLVGKNAVFHGPDNVFLFNNNLLRIRFSEGVISDFISYFLNQEAGINQIRSFISGTTSVAALYWKDFSTIKIPLPSLEIQQSIVERIEEEQRLVDANRRLIEIYEGKIREKMDEVWGIK